MDCADLLVEFLSRIEPAALHTECKQKRGGRCGGGQMATPEMTASSAALETTTTIVPAPNYTRPLAIVTTLFFMWGFLTCLNDILVPHLKAIFDLNFAQVMLVQFAFFSAYFF